MTDFNWALSARELIQDPIVVEEFDRLSARLKGFLQGYGQTDLATAVTLGASGAGGPALSKPVTFNSRSNLSVIAVNIGTNQSMLDPSEAVLVRVNPTANVTIHGMGGIGDKGGADSTTYRHVYIYVPKEATFTLTLANESASAVSADQRFQLVGAANVSTVAGQARAFEFIYDGIVRRWVMLGGSAAISAATPTVTFVSHTQAGTAADTAETDLVTTTLAASVLSANGDVLVIRAAGNFANNAQGKRLRFYWAGTAIADTGAQAWQDQGWQLHVVIIRRTSSTQAIHAQFIPAIAGVSASPGDFTAGTADLTATVAIKITGTNSVATANDITFEEWFGFVIKGV